MVNSILFKANKKNYHAILLKGFLNRLFCENKSRHKDFFQYLYIEKKKKN